jgi:hypothetical protein
MDSELQILISAVDEASGTIAEVGDSVAAMSESVTEATEAASSSFADFGLQVNETTGEIENALLTQEQSFALAADMATQSSDEIIELMASEGISSQEAAAVIQEANAEIAASGEAASTASAGAYAGLAAIAGIAFLGIKSAISDAVSSAQQWDETSAQIAQILRDTGSAIPLSQIQAYAQQVQSTTLFTQQDVLASEALIVSHTDLQGSFEQVTNIAADLATKMGSDLPNATRVLTNALADPVAGLNQLIRQGNIDFPAATVTMIENLAKAGDTAGADAVILQTLQTSIGGVAQAAAGAPGAALTQLNNQLAALGTVVGNDLLPLLDTLAKDLEPVIQDVTQWAAAHPKLTDAIVIGTAALVALALVIGVVEVAIITITPVVEMIGVAIAALSGPIGLAILVIGVLAAVIASNWSLIENDTETIWDGITTFFTTTFNWLKNLFTSSLDDVSNIWTSAWTDMSTFLGNIWATIENTVKTGVNYVITAINAFINALDALHISIPSIAIPGTKLSTPSINLGFSIPDIPMLAAGGFVTQPTLALIGEAGPEAVVPLSQMGGGAGGQQIVVNINGGIFPADQSAIKQIGDMLAKSIVTQLRVKNYAL